MNIVINGIKKTILFTAALVLVVCTLVLSPQTKVSAAEKSVYSFMNDFPKSQGENGWRVYCGATDSFYDSSKGRWTNGDTHQTPSYFKKDIITTCNNGGVSYIDFIAPKSGSVAVVFKAKVKAPERDGGDGTYGGGLFGIHLSDPKRTNPNQADKQSAEPVFPAGLESWFISGRYELQDGETLVVEEFLDIDKGQLVQFCFCSKGDPWTFTLDTFEIRYDDEGSTNSSANQGTGVTSSNTSTTTSDNETVSDDSTTSSEDSTVSDDSTVSEPETSGDSNSNNDILLDWNTDDDEPKEKSYTALIVGIIICDVIIIAIIVAVFVICKVKGII